MHTPNSSILNRYSINYSAIQQVAQSLPLKEYQQIPYIIDVLGRCHQHHVILHGFSSANLRAALLESIALHLKTGHVPKQLSNADLIFFDAKRLCVNDEDPARMHQELLSLCDEAVQLNKHIIFALNDISLFNKQTEDTSFVILSRLMRSKLYDDQWRILVLTENHQPLSHHFDALFSTVQLNQLNGQENLAILKACREQIESFHNVIMPDDIFAYALSLTSHYLGGKCLLDAALELLDSGAARASTLDRQDPTFKPILTTTILAHVVSNWTHIPLSHLHHNKFKLTKFLQHVQQKIFGQESAINTIGALLQSTCIKLKEQDGPGFNVLLTGPDGVGKKEFAYALANYLFSNQESLLQIILDKHANVSSLSDIKVTTQANASCERNLLDAIQAKPYSIILLENLEEMPASTIDLFTDIFTQGFVCNQQGQVVSFKHAIVIITTTLGSSAITSILQRHSEPGSTHIMDLMQLVLNDNASHTGPQYHISQKDIQDHLLPALSNCFNNKILQNIHIIPFMPLDQNSLEKIIKLKLSAFAKTLEDEFGVELAYAPEIIKFLAHLAIKQHENAQSLKKLFDQHVYACVANEILARIEDKNRPKRLALLLNDSGQLLHCEFMVTNGPSIYSI